MLGSERPDDLKQLALLALAGTTALDAVLRRLSAALGAAGPDNGLFTRPANEMNTGCAGYLTHPWAFWDAAG